MTEHIKMAIRLATLLGHTDITPEGRPCWRIYEGLYARDDDGDKSRLPDWLHDNGAAFVLMTEHDCYPQENCGFISVRNPDYSPLVKGSPINLAFVEIADHADKKAAVRYAIVQAVITKLKAAQVSA